MKSVLGADGLASAGGEGIAFGEATAGTMVWRVLGGGRRVIGASANRGSHDLDTKRVPGWPWRASRSLACESVGRRDASVRVCAANIRPRRDNWIGQGARADMTAAAGDSEGKDAVMSIPVETWRAAKGMWGQNERARAYAAGRTTERELEGSCRAKKFRARGIDRGVHVSPRSASPPFPLIPSSRVSLRHLYHDHVLPGPHPPRP